MTEALIKSFKRIEIYANIIQNLVLRILYQFTLSDNQSCFRKHSSGCDKIYNTRYYSE
jgi:hypothetical protein